MIRIHEETNFDSVAREALLDRAYGDQRFGKVSEALRRDRLPAQGLALVAKEDGSHGESVIGTLRLWNIVAGGRPALLLGPLAVDPHRQGEGVGAALMEAAIGRARALGHGAILLVGDEPYYGRFGFSADLTARLAMPGRVDPARFLALELVPGALAGAAGKLEATGRLVPPDNVIPLAAKKARGARGGLRLKAA